VAAVLVTLAAVGLIVCIRRRRNQKRLDALMPWNNNPNNNSLYSNSGGNGGAGNGTENALELHKNRFSKVSSIDDDITGSNSPGGGGGSTGAQAMSAAAVVSGAIGVSSAYELNSQPISAQSRNYYQEGTDYEHLLQQGGGGPSGVFNSSNQGGTSPNPEEDAYYNPYYANNTVDVNQSNHSFFTAMGSPAAPNQQFSPFSPEIYQNNMSPASMYQQYQYQQQLQQQSQPGVSGTGGAYFPAPPPLMSSLVDRAGGSPPARSPASIPAPSSNPTTTTAPTSTTSLTEVVPRTSAIAAILSSMNSTNNSPNLNNPQNPQAGSAWKPTATTSATVVDSVDSSPRRGPQRTPTIVKTTKPTAVVMMEMSRRNASENEQQGGPSGSTRRENSSTGYGKAELTAFGGDSPAKRSLTTSTTSDSVTGSPDGSSDVENEDAEGGAANSRVSADDDENVPLKSSDTLDSGIVTTSTLSR
ncbi:hypothetical protein BGZ83_002241, partial [Gryganskiella cystojenkinii]